MLRTFIQVIALLLTITSAVFLIRSVAGMSVKDMAELSKTAYGGYTLRITENLARQKSDTVVGFSLLILSFLFALINLLWPMRFCDFVVDRKGVLIAIVVSIIISLVAYKISNSLHRKWCNQAKDILSNASNIKCDNEKK